MLIPLKQMTAVDTTPTVQIAQKMEGSAQMSRGTDDFDYWFEQCETLCALEPDFNGEDPRQIERYQNALHSRERAIAFDPDDALAWTNQGVILQRLGRYAEALVSHNRALDLVPNYALAWNNRGVVLERLGRNAAALESYEKALELDPSNELVRHNRNNLRQWLQF